MTSTYGVDLSKIPSYKRFCEFCKNHHNMMKVVDEYLKSYPVVKEGELENWFDEDSYEDFVIAFPGEAEGSFAEFAYIMSRFIELEHKIELEAKADRTETYHCLMCTKENKSGTESIIQSYLNELYDSSNMPKFKTYKFKDFRPDDDD